ncbi:MAG: hypothetical protein PHQ90_06300 [Sulfuricurvum sp.]|uniref:hypothetical protein n=1 Tax=Sulfuricurvum sp. TaxID=2025608 RepID=UPI00261D0D51|nr:hypothetical protein [Sulfuricurvum sp.]MDD2368896.1 hypothetical protein [Sulfuricurvum sp.]MDD5118497.1 hypothetical protein [Sulfuricurvum sp.]
MKKRNIFLTVALGIVTTAYYTGISFSIPIFNTVVFGIALISFIILSNLLATENAKFYIKLIFAFGWVYTFVFGIFLLTGLIDCRNSDLSNIDETQFCTRSGYGFVGTDSGEEIRAYKRFWIFDKEIGLDRSSVMYQSPKVTMGIYAFCKDKKIVEIK